MSADQQVPLTNGAKVLDAAARVRARRDELDAASLKLQSAQAAVDLAEQAYGEAKSALREAKDALLQLCGGETYP